MSVVHLGFDMGIKNLAFCLIRHTPVSLDCNNKQDCPTEKIPWTILAWDNVDLLAGGQSSQDSRRCCACPSPAIWCNGEELWCKGCATGIRRKKSATRIPTKPILPCGLTLKDLKGLGKEKGWDKSLKKEALQTLAKEQYLFPWKAPRATRPSLQAIIQSMDSWLDRMLPTFAQATLIRLENQPVMKGPTMKSIQIMLFTLLAHRLSKEHTWSGRIEFVHAGTKTKDAEGQTTLVSDIDEEKDEEKDKDNEKDAGKAYRNRKKTAETETQRFLEEQTSDSHKTWLRFFQSRSKKNDLADAFLMALRK